MKNVKFLIFLLIISAVYLLMISSGGQLINPFSAHAGSPGHYILFNLRIPRIAAASLIGACLSLSALIFQSIFRNPLAEAYTTGVSGGASFAAALAIIAAFPMKYVPLFAFAGSCISAILTIAAAKRFQLTDSRLILFGVSLNMFFSSGVMLLFSFSESRAVHKALSWMMGDISIARFELIPVITAVFIVCLVFTAFSSEKLNIISFGDSFRISSGVKNSEVYFLFIAGGALVAASVSAAGIIPFVGIIIPHICRYFFGENRKKLIFIVPITGAVFLALCDTVSRSIFYPFEIPAGIITGFIGGGFFLAVIFKGTLNKSL